MSVITRNRMRMYTAFTLADGRAVLNIAVSGPGGQHGVSILIEDDQDRAALAREDRGTPMIIERLIATGRRLPAMLPTPSASEPIIGYQRAA